MQTSSRELTSEWRWLWREIRPYWSYQAANLGCIVVLTACTAGVPLLIKWLIDDIVPQRRWDHLAIASGLIGILYVGRVLINSAGLLINGLGVQRMIFHLRNRLVSHVQSLPSAFYARHSVGDLVQRLERDVMVVGELGSVVMPSLARMVVKLIVTVAIMILLDWRLACVVAPLLPVFAYVRRHCRDSLRQCAEDVREAAGQQSNLLNEMLTGAIQVQLLGAEQRLLRRYIRLDLSTMHRRLKQRRSEELFKILEMSIIAFGTTLIIGYGGARVISGALTTGGLVAFFAYVGSIFEPMEVAVELYTRLQRVRACIRRLIAIDQAPTEIRDLPEAMPLVDRPHALVCRDVSFSYTPNRRTLRAVTFEVKAGERVAVVGESGGGKSSLLKLIPRLYDPDEGCVEIDGRDIRGLRLHSVRQAISFVPQDPILFRGTIRENLQHGCPTGTPDQFAEAAWIACFTEIIERLPRGWDTELGPLGAGLSGGERQRLAIARALLQRRPVLVLDEATSALDLPTEHRLLGRLAPVCGQSIVFVVSHRPAVPRWASRVLVISDGAVCEDGTHDTLHRPGTRYYQLWRSHDGNGSPSMMWGRSGEAASPVLHEVSTTA